MGVRVLFDRDERKAVIYDSVTGTAFGPLFNGWDPACLDADDEAYAFLVWLDEAAGVDPRVMTDDELVGFVARWHSALEQIGETTIAHDRIVALAVDYDTVATMRGTEAKANGKS